jgi:hypothetical protein
MTRTERQRRIERLLGQIRDRVGEQERMKARGVSGRPLAERAQELSDIRAQLAAIVAHASDDDARTTSSTGRTVVRTAAPGRSRRSTAHSAAIVPSS